MTPLVCNPIFKLGYNSPSIENKNSLYSFEANGSPDPVILINISLSGLFDICTSKLSRNSLLILKSLSLKKFLIFSLRQLGHSRLQLKSLQRCIYVTI